MIGKPEHRRRQIDAIARRLTLIGFFLAFSPVFAQGNPWGERIRDFASRTLPMIPESIASSPFQDGKCDTCGQPTLFNRNRCFHCLQQQAPHQFKQWADETMSSAREKLDRMRDPKFREDLINMLMDAKRQFQDQNQVDSDYEKAQKRAFYENLGRIKLSDGKSVNDLARETVRQYLPALQGTDWEGDPARVISYFLIVDGKGFIEQVKCVRGPLGEPMTLLEAYQYYTGTDPQKAKDILEILDNVRKLSTPGNRNESIPTLLDTLARSLRLLGK